MGSKSGKSGGSYQLPPSTYTMPDNSAATQLALQSYQSSINSILQSTRDTVTSQLAALEQQSYDYTSSLPEIIGAEAAKTDWAAKAEELKAKMAAEYEADKAKKTGRTDTILTSPLLDQQDAVTTSSILTGG